MKILKISGLFRSSMLVLIALAGLSGPAVANVAVGTQPVDARAGDFVLLEITGSVPREDFWVAEASLWDLRLVEQQGSNARYEAEVDIAYKWSPAYDGPLKRTPFSATVRLGQFPTAATVDIKVRFAPLRGLPRVLDVESEATATIQIGSGSARCEPNEVLLNASATLCTQAIRFGTYHVGERSAEMPVFIRNRGTSTLYLGPIDVNNADYGLTRRCGEWVEPGQACEVVLTFSPSIDGNSPGRLNISYGTHPEQRPFRRATVALSGDSVMRPTRLPTRGSRVVEFYASSVDQYFLTAREADMNVLDQSSSGWRRTGVTFLASGEFPTCRFYGDLVAGPRGHFFTARIDACDSLKLQDTITPRGQQVYRYEGITFSIGLPGLSMHDERYRCEEGRPIYQMRRPAGGGRDVAYRLIPGGSLDGGINGDNLVRTMLGAGWDYQGQVMCSVAPPAE